MAWRALKYNRSGIYHFEKVFREYKNFLKTQKLSENNFLSVMDIGCGSGRVLQEILTPLLPKNVSEIVGSDLYEGMIEFCKSNNNNPKTSFLRLNIEDEHIPTQLQNRFDLLFSSYCFSHVVNLQQGIKNCSKLLKPNGRLCFIFQYKTHALYSTYKKMSSMIKWKIYTEDFKNFTPHFSGVEPESDLLSTYRNTGLNLIHYKFEPDFYVDLIRRDLISVYDSIDVKAGIIPKELQKDYRDDYLSIMSAETKINLTDDEHLDEFVRFSVPTVCVSAQKI